MKKSILTLTLLFFSCRGVPSLQENAEAKVKSYLKANLHDPTSYSPVSFSKISEYSPFGDTSTEREKNRYLIHKFDSAYFLIHTFRAKNLIGGLGLQEIKVYFDYNLNVLPVKNQ